MSLRAAIHDYLYIRGWSVSHSTSPAAKYRAPLQQVSNLVDDSALSATARISATVMGVEALHVRQITVARSLNNSLARVKAAPTSSAYSPTPKLKSLPPFPPLDCSKRKTLGLPKTSKQLDLVTLVVCFSFST